MKHISNQGYTGYTRTDSGVDGVDHVRVSMFGRTTLGRMLSDTYAYTYKVPGCGSFKNIKCFANWIFTGLEEHRYEDKVYPNLDIFGRKIRHNYEWIKFILYAKFFQIKAMSTAVDQHRIVNDIDLLTLPFVMYRDHAHSGIRESASNLWREYTNGVKEVVTTILLDEEPPRKHLETSALVDKYLEAIAKILKDQGMVVQEDAKPRKPSTRTRIPLEEILKDVEATPMPEHTNSLPEDIAIQDVSSTESDTL